MWHQKHRKENYIPEDLRAVDTDASWSTSKYRGWVFGYGLHLTTTISGFPRFVYAYTASVSEKTGLDQKMDTLIPRQTKSIVVDAGYTDFTRIQTLAKKELFLITLITDAKKDKKVAYLQAIETSPELRGYQQHRKTAIELVFSLLSDLAAIESKRKEWV